jgi:hypothetical protein
MSGMTPRDLRGRFRNGAAVSASTRMVLGVALVLFGACHSPTGVYDYYPLALNNSWRYTWHVAVTERGRQDTTYAWQTTSQKSVVAETPCGDANEWTLFNRQGNDTFSESWFSSDSEVDDCWPVGEMGAAPRTLLKLPLAENASWVSWWSEYGNVPLESAVVTSHGLLAVPAGIFTDVWQVRYVNTDANPPETTRMWYAGGVGPVKTWLGYTSRDETDTIREEFTQTLTGYSVR